MIDSVERAAEALMKDARPCGLELHLGLGSCHLRVRSNSTRLMEQLTAYFAHVASQSGAADIDVLAIEQDAPDLGVAFTHWKREPGKTGRKDSYFDVPGGRLVRKVRTGMVFLQSQRQRIAAGPCCRFDNQVINFINAQYMNWLQHRHWLICHAAGLVCGGRGLGIAGFSGGGKSTLMLRLLERERTAYLTNDRLFVRRRGEEVEAVGIPKQPRVNPGTIVHNPRLHGLISAPERERLLALPREELWELEDKYDVLVEQVYGANRIATRARLSSFLVLNWRRDASQPPRVEPVALAERPDLLGAIMKSPGPFYQYPDGSFYQDTTPLDGDAYLPVLDGVDVFEATGRVDFDALAGQCADRLMG